MGERRRALCKRARPFCAHIKDGGQPASANGAEVRGLSVFYSAGQSESAASSATTTQLVCSCRMEAGQLGVTGPKHMS